MFAENTMVGTKQTYNWNACSFKYSTLGEKESTKGIQSEGKCGIKNTADLWLTMAQLATPTFVNFLRVKKEPQSSN